MLIFSVVLYVSLNVPIIPLVRLLLADLAFKFSSIFSAIIILDQQIVSKKCLQPILFFIFPKKQEFFEQIHFCVLQKLQQKNQINKGSIHQLVSLKWKLEFFKSFHIYSVMKQFLRIEKGMTRYNFCFRSLQRYQSYFFVLLCFRCVCQKFNFVDFSTHRFSFFVFVVRC